MNRYEILKNRLGLSGGIGGGEVPKKDPPPSGQLSYPQINQWSDFVEGNPGIKGMDSMWNAFSSKYPQSGIDRQVLTSNLDILMKRVQDTGRSWGEDTPHLLTPGMSFPKMFFNGKPYGRVNAMMQTETPIPQPPQQYPERLISKEIPDSVKDFWWDENKGLWAYDDPHEGVIKYAQKSAGNTPKMREIAKAAAENKQSTL
jgi:hypothetical protein